MISQMMLETFPNSLVEKNICSLDFNYLRTNLVVCWKLGWKPQSISPEHLLQRIEALIDANLRQTIEALKRTGYNFLIWLTRMRVSPASIERQSISAAQDSGSDIVYRKDASFS